MNKKVFVIFAPTATGKTELLFRLFSDRDSPFRIISADSMQVYRGLDICSAKPSLEERSRLEHFLVDIKNPDEQFSAAEFVERADSLCDDFLSRNLIPLVCGGTGFYIRSFLLGLPKTPPGDEQVRARLKNDAEKFGSDAMWKRLFSVDEESARKINPADLYRILRALEIYELTGKPRAEFAAREILREKYDFKILILERDREDLYERIDARVEKMFAAGLEKEIADLAKTYSPDSPGMKAIGCREFFEGGTIQEIKARIKHDSKRYAKKQYVFMKGIPNAKTIHIPRGADFPQETLEFFSE